jgi:DnaK suppressor protein
MDLEKIKEQLLAQKENLEKQAAYYQSEDPYLSENRDMTSTLDDDITENEGHDRITAARNETISSLNSVNRTLERLEAGTYGKCVRCGKEISAERLLIMPTAELCMDDENRR